MSHLFRFILETKELEKDEAFFFWKEKGGGDVWILPKWVSKIIVLSWLGTDGKFNPTTLKNRKCSMKFPKKPIVYHTLWTLLKMSTKWNV
jgi:hypothetical protein